MNVHRPTAGINGFTLLEIILSLILLGIIGAVAGMGFVSITQGFIIAKRNAETVQKGQMAITRLIEELGSISTQAVSATTQTSITYVFNGETHTISWDGVNDSTLLLNGQNILMDHVSSLQLTYHNSYDSAAAQFSPNTRIIEMRLSLNCSSGVVKTFVNRAYLRPYM
jgi:prepilin-type N-terminal cleavage/methylation domain-containing protein